MKLVRYENFSVVVDPELLLLKPFKRVYNKDRSDSKKDFMDFMAILYFVYDPRSDFMYILNEETRLQEVCKANGISVPRFGEWESQCVELYKKMTTTVSLTLLQNTRAAIDKISSFLMNIDLEERDDKGRLVNSVSQIVAAIDKIPQLVAKVSEAERQVSKEILEEGRARGGNENKTIGEDGLEAFL